MASNQQQAHGVRLRNVVTDAQWLGAQDVCVTSCCSDSRQVQSGDLFVALPGVEHDGHEFAREALARGAAAFLVERPVPLDGRPMCVVPDVREAYGHLCQALAGHPSLHMGVIGITGTNGKTTTTLLTAGILQAAGQRVGTIGTLGIDDTIEAVPGSMTTPSAPVLAERLSRMQAAGCRSAVMEVSSHALSQRRVAGIQFDAACFTNIRHDHLDYHTTVENYRRAKAQLLQHLTPDGVLILNADDPHCMAMGSHGATPTVTFGVHSPADVTATVVERFVSEQTFLLSVGRESIPVRTGMIGDHHLANCLAAAALGVAHGVDLATIARGIESVGQVPGRMERIECGQPFQVFVDYAHTADALAATLRALDEVTTGRLICVFGAGGDRDREKRPAMAAHVDRWTQLAVITNDNPRGECPQEIARQLRSGFRRISSPHLILDRGAAIAWALAEAEPGDTVLIAGKGHENTQTMGRQKFYFDDREVARQWLYRMGRRTPHGFGITNLDLEQRSSAASRDTRPGG